MEAALASFGELKAAGGGEGPGALRVLGQLAKAGLSQHPSGGQLKLADLEAQLPSVAGLAEEDMDQLESSVPGRGHPRQGQSEPLQSEGLVIIWELSAIEALPAVQLRECSGAVELQAHAAAMV